MEKFTVLQSVYINDKAEWLDLCLESIYQSTILPDKVVIVRDGPVSQEVEEVLSKWNEKIKLQVVGYETNRGLPYAMNFGMKFVDTELVARMDSDDIIYPERFEKQLDYFEKNADVVLLSGYISEFNVNSNEIVSTRIVPLDNLEIRTYLKRRNAFNHMAVIFKKSAILSAGAYQDVPYFEDYDLWIRVVQKGYIVANIPELLVKARVGNDMIGRRHGWGYARHEINFLKRQRKNGFINKKEYIYLLLMRVPVRLLPQKVLELIYKFLRS